MIDRHSKDWKTIKNWAEDRLIRIARKLEVKGLDAQRSEYLRGEIATLRSLLALEDQEAPPNPTNPNPYL